MRDEQDRMEKEKREEQGEEEAEDGGKKEVAEVKLALFYIEVKFQFRFCAKTVAGPRPPVPERRRHLLRPVRRGRAGPAGKVSLIFSAAKRSMRFPPKTHVMCMHLTQPHPDRPSHLRPRILLLLLLLLLANPIPPATSPGKPLPHQQRPPHQQPTEQQPSPSLCGQAQPRAGGDGPGRDRVHL